MRKITLMTLFLALTLSLKAQDWKEELIAKNVGVIDSVTLLNDASYADDNFSSYMIYYKQPLNHDAPEEGYLSLRALLIINRFRGNIIDNMIQMSIGGYGLDSEIIQSPNYWAEYVGPESSQGELAGEYFGHILMPEHRFYGESRPEDCVSSLSCCNAKEAAADFHSLAEAMKKVFQGKWAITGVSKGGVATAIQHALYPDDADCFVPYVGPMLNGVNDLRPQEYWLTKTWTPELREHALYIQKEMLNRPKVMEYMIGDQSNRDEETRAWNQYKFLYNVACRLDETVHQYTDRSVIENIFSSNKAYLHEHGLADYTDEMLYYMLFDINYSISIDSRYEEFFGEDDSSLARTRALPSTLTDNNIYDYQSLTELGYFDMKWDFYYDTQAKADSVNALWKRVYPSVLFITAPDDFQTLEYDPSIINYVNQQTAKAEKSILFIYGEDDPWTGACIADEYVNGDNVRKYILPAQNHTASIFAIKEESMKQELLSFLGNIFQPAADGIISARDEAAKPSGIVFDKQNRRFIIRRDGQRYDLMGRLIK